MGEQAKRSWPFSSAALVRLREFTVSWRSSRMATLSAS